MTPVTAWHRHDKKSDKFLFNHIEDGESTAEKPEDTFGRGWKGQRWEKKAAMLVGPNNVLTYVEAPLLVG